MQCHVQVEDGRDVQVEDGQHIQDVAVGVRPVCQLDEDGHATGTYE